MHVSWKWISSPYPCNDLNFFQTCLFFLCVSKQQPRRWVCLGQLMGRSKSAQIRKIQFNFSNQQHTSFREKEGEKSFLNILFHNTSNLNCSWHCLLLRSPSISVWQWFWQWAGWLQQSIQKFLSATLHWGRGDLTYFSCTISSRNSFRKCSDLSTLNWHPKHTKIYTWLLSVPEKLCLRNTLFCCFLPCFLHRALRSISLCSLQHWHTAINPWGHMEHLWKSISWVLWINYFPVDSIASWSSYRPEFCIALQVSPDGSVLGLE